MPMTAVNLPQGFVPFVLQSDQLLSAASRSWLALDLAMQQGTRVLSHAPLPLHEHEEHEVNLVIQGFGRVVLNTGESLAFGAGQLLFLPSGLSHRLDASSQLFVKGFHLHPQVMRTLISPMLSTDLQAYFTVPSRLPATIIHTRFFHLMLEMVELSLEEWRRTSAWHTDSLLAIRQWLCVTLLRLLNEEASVGKDSFTLHRIAQVKGWIDANYIERVTLSELAAQASLSPTYFSMLFQQLYQVAPKTYQRQCCLRHAAQQLLETDLPINIIGCQNGFVDMAHFSRAFREYMGISPKQYRQANRTTAEERVQVRHDAQETSTAIEHA